jgi:Sulfotransferase family
VTARPECQPFYVYGAAHSGTTILYRLLALHPEAAWFSQYSQRDGSVAGRWRLPFAHAVDRSLRPLLRHDWRKENRRLRLTPRPDEARTILLYVLAAPTRSEAAARLRRVVDDECRRWRRRVLLAKPLPLRGQLDLLGAAHPEARILHIVRDGRAVAASLRHKFMRSGESPAEGVEQAAAHWVERIDEVERLGLPTLTLRYEDLCADVHRALGRALEHASLDPDRFPFDRVPRALAVTNEGRLEELSRGELDAVQAAQTPALRSLGYLDT